MQRKIILKFNIWLGNILFWWYSIGWAQKKKKKKKTEKKNVKDNSMFSSFPFTHVWLNW